MLAAKRICASKNEPSPRGVSKISGRYRDLLNAGQLHPTFLLRPGNGRSLCPGPDWPSRTSAWHPVKATDFSLAGQLIETNNTK